MILGIDVGNSNVVAALLNETGVIKEKRCQTIKQNIEKQYYMKSLNELMKNQKIEGVIISSVVPEINQTLKEIIEENIKITPIFVNADLKTGIYIKYDNPHKLGADLITVAVGATLKYGSPVIIIDIGTATTFSVINENNEYLGGMIAPGPHTSIKALSKMTSQLPEIDFISTDKIIGTNTIDCIKIGTITAHSAMIDGMLDRVLSTLKEPNVKIIATGGEAKEIIDMCSHKITLDKNLIFDGLYEIYRQRDGDYVCSLSAFTTLRKRLHKNKKSDIISK